MHREIFTPDTFGAALSKLSCAVKRIDDPHSISVQPLKVVCCLFGEHAISWKSFRECRRDG
jgi:hypothetical protein